MSLADVVAASRCARNIVLVGDPRQLAQVVQGTHPTGAGVSGLEHLLGDDVTIPPDRGIFLDRTWRMAPAVRTSPAMAVPATVRMVAQVSKVEAMVIGRNLRVRGRGGQDVR